MERDIEINHFVPTKQYVAKSNREITRLASDILDGNIFCSLQIKDKDEHLLKFIFFPLLFLSPIDKKQLKFDRIEHLYGTIVPNQNHEQFVGDMKYPCLNNMQYLDDKDSERLKKILLPILNEKGK